MPETPPDVPHLKPLILAPPEAWLASWIAPVLARYAAIEQVYLLGNHARGRYGQKPDYSLLLYAGYDRALELLTSLARDENELRTTDGIVHLYVENYGATFCGIWGGGHIPNELNRAWEAGADYLLWIERGDQARLLSERLSLPLERRAGQRRGEAQVDEAQAGESRDLLQTLWPPQSSADQHHSGERRNSDRRRDVRELLKLNEQH